MSQRFTGKVVIVTGSGGGIGAATARRFAAEGAAVVCADINEESARAVGTEITAAGGTAAACGVDIRDAAQVDAMIEFTKRQFGAPNIAVNNAGMGAQKHFLETPLETLHAIAPGAIDVPRNRKQHTGERREAWHRAVPLARYGAPEEIAGVAAFLASDDASYLTGQTISVDGGFSIAGLRVKDLTVL